MLSLYSDTLTDDTVKKLDSHALHELTREPPPSTEQKKRKEKKVFGHRTSINILLTKIEKN